MEELRKGTISTVEIAEMMGISHKVVLRKLDGRDEKGKHVKGIIEVLTQHHLVPSDYFVESTYQSVDGKKNKCYECTRMGCEFLANKFTGEKGILFTAEYVKRFNLMQEAIRQNSIGTPEAPGLEDMRKRFDELEEKVKAIETKATNPFEIKKESELKTRRKKLNDAIGHLSDLCGIPETTLLHYMYVAMKREVQLDSLVEAYQIATNRKDLNTFETVVNFDILYNCAIELTEEAIERTEAEKIFGRK